MGCGRTRKGDKVRALLRVVSVTGVLKVAFSWRKVSKNRDVKSGVGMFQRRGYPGRRLWLKDEKENGEEGQVRVSFPS